MEGVPRYQVRLLPHNRRWRDEYAEVRRRLEAVWGGNIAAVEHVGSTAVEGLCAKPILDVAVRLKSIAGMDADALISLGYDACGPQRGNPAHHLYVLRGENRLSLHHIHCYGPEEREFFQLVGFRDYLAAHRDAARRYAALKRRLAARHPGDRAAYTAGKAEFIRSIYAKLTP